MKNEATVALVLDTKEKRPDKLLKIRVTFNRVPHLYSVNSDKRLTKEQFCNDKLKITKEAKESARKAVEIANSTVKELGPRFSFFVFKDKYTERLLGKISSNKSTFITYAEKYISNLPSLKSQESYKIALNWVRSFSANPNFNDFSKDYIMLLINHIKDKHREQHNKEISENTVRIYLRSLSAIYQSAIRDGIAPEPNSFKGNSMQPLGSIPREKGALTSEELDVFLKYEPSNSAEQFGKDFFVLSLLLCGANIGDILSLKNRNVQNDEIVFIRRKTRKAGMNISVPLLDESVHLLNKYGCINPEKPDDYILPYLSSCRSEESVIGKIHDTIGEINKGIKSVCEQLGLPKLTTYNARHTYAVFASGEMEVSEIQKFLGHTSSKTTDTYLRSITTSSKEKNRKVLESFVKKV